MYNYFGKVLGTIKIIFSIVILGSTNFMVIEKYG